VSIRIVVASGKGGTGKTLVATSLALVAAERGLTALLDADVEAPNAGLFLRPSLHERSDVLQMVPSVDPSVCQHCGRCAEVCQFHAIAALPERTLVFPDLCHGCGSCVLNCPSRAITELPRSIGMIEGGHVDGLAFAQGTLAVGEAMATPIIHALKRYASASEWGSGAQWVIVDAPPGTACPVIESLRGADVALLVTEPTPFGLHDLRLAVEVARDALDIPVAVVINKDTPEASDMDEYCRAEHLPVLLRIPLERAIAVAYSDGQPLVEAMPEYRNPFRTLLTAAGRLARRGTA
jgi:MinD superfamily P-loop ATPase